MNQPEDSFDRQRRLTENVIKEFGKKNAESYEQTFQTGKADSSYDCSVFDYFGVNVFFYAAMTGNLFWVKELVKQDASVYAKDQNGKTALHFAIQSGNLELIEFLVEQGADVNAKDEWGIAVLNVAKLNKYEQMVEFLKERGAEEKVEE